MKRLRTIGGLATAWRRALYGTVISISVLTPATAPAAQGEGTWMLQPFSAVYDLKKGNLKVGERRLILSRDGSTRYRFDSTSHTSGVVSWFKDDRILEQSRWIYHDGIQRPLQYRYEHIGSKHNREISVVFDWSRKRATNVAAQVSWAIDIPPGTQDKLLYLLRIMQELDSGGRRLVFPVADGGKLKHFRFRVAATENLDTPLGTLRTLRLHRIRNTGKRETTIWSAEALNYLPVRIDHREKDGSVFSMQIQSVKGLPQP